MKRLVIALAAYVLFAGWIFVSSCTMEPPTAPRLDCRYEIVIGDSLPTIHVSAADTNCIRKTDSGRQVVEFLRFHGGMP